MKKLNRLLINYERIIRKEELIALRGGEACTCCCGDWNHECCYGYLLSQTGNCDADCKYVFGMTATGLCGNCASNCPVCTGY